MCNTRFLLIQRYHDLHILLLPDYIWFSDVSTTMIVKPRKVLEFLPENQNVWDIRDIDRTKVQTSYVF